ncbi:MAG: hypothetical protein ACRBN8_07700 [Nannocystales bacterium]
MSHWRDRKFNPSAWGRRVSVSFAVVTLHITACLTAGEAAASPTSGEDDTQLSREVTDPVGVTQDSSSQAQSDADKAKELRATAEECFFEEDYEGALEAFSAAMELSPHSTDLFNMGRIHEEMGELPEALLRYEQFVTQPRIPLEERAAAADRIEVLRKLVQEDAPDSPTASARPDGMDTRADRDYEAQRRGQTRLFAAGVTLAGLGGALAVGGGVGFGIVARRNSDRIDDLSAGQNPGRLTLREAEDLEARGRDFEAMQVAAIATGGVLAGVGAIMAVIARRRLDRTERNYAQLRSISPVFSSQTLALQARWSF